VLSVDASAHCVAEGASACASAACGDLLRHHGTYGIGVGQHESVSFHAEVDVQMRNVDAAGCFSAVNNLQGGVVRASSGAPKGSNSAAVVCDASPIEAASWLRCLATSGGA
jgi:hypothetical protein